MTIEESFKKSEFKSIYLLIGNESYLIDNYLNKFKKLVSYPDYDLFEYSDAIDFDSLSNILLSNPMLSDRKVVIIDNREFSNKISNNYFDLFSKISDKTILVITERDADKRSPKFKSSLYKYVEKNGVVTKCLPVDLYQLKTLAERYFKSQKVNLDSHTLQYFVEKVGVSPDINVMINEANKLINYSRDEEKITKEIIDKVCITSLEDKVFDMIKSQIRKDNFRLEKLYADLYNLKEEPKKIFALIKDQYLKLISVKSMENLAKADDEIMKTIGINFDWALKDLKVLAKRIEIGRLEIIIDRIASLEVRMKGNNINPSTALEILIFNV